MKELTSAAIITIGYDATENGRLVERRIKCVVPASWLWSPEGLADAFNRLRAGLLPQPADGDEDAAWDSFHIVHMIEETEYYVEGERDVESVTVARKCEEQNRNQNRNRKGFLRLV